MSIKHILSGLDGVIRLYPESRERAIEEKYQLPKSSFFNSAFRNPLLQEVVCGRISDDMWRKDILERLKEISSDNVVKTGLRLRPDMGGCCHSTLSERAE